jgi:hypothetical protein
VRGVVLLVTAVVLLLAGMAWVAFAPAPAGTVTPSEAWFERAYDLDHGEVVRFVPPPYPPQRMALAPWLGKTAPPQDAGEMLFHAGAVTHFWLGSTATGTLRSSIAHVADLVPVDYDIPDDLGNLPIIGDWVVRPQAPREQQIAAMQDILCQVLRRPIIIEKRLMPRPAIIVSGRYQFHSLRRGRLPNEVQLFCDTLDPEEGAGGGTGEFKRLLRRIEQITGRRVLDRSDAPPAQVVWSNNHSARDAGSDPAKLQQLLANLAGQTSLEFEQSTADVEVYFVRETVARPPASQP